MNVFEQCPTVESERFVLRKVGKEDRDDLLEVYGDKSAYSRIPIIRL